MNSQEKNIRNFVKNLLKENYQEIDEANKGKQFNSYFELVFKNIKPNIPENKFSDIEILQKAKELINNKLTKVFLKDFEYTDFIIVKLGKFVLNDKGVRSVLTFSKERDIDKGYSYMYLYIYHNTIELIRFGSSFFEDNNALFKEAKEFIKNRDIKLVTKTEVGKLEIKNEFEKDNIIDVTDYSKIQKQAPIERHGALYDKSKNYKVGDNFLHKNLGAGKVVKTKRVTADVPTIDVSVQFKGGEQKRFRMEKPMMGQIQSQQLS